VARWTTADLGALPYDEWHRYEIVAGELFVEPAPVIPHQAVITQLIGAFYGWDRDRRWGSGLHWPGVILSETDSVIPDFVWMSRERRAAILRDDGYFHGAPELVVEILSPGAALQRRDREAKLTFYSTHGVDEYWMVDWSLQTVAVHRRADGALRLAMTLTRDDALTSPLLPGFSFPAAQLFTC
jgi:Uma2 family endonuclease